MTKYERMIFCVYGIMQQRDDVKLIYESNVCSVAVQAAEISKHKDICTLSYSKDKIVEYDNKGIRKVYIIDFDVSS